MNSILVILESVQDIQNAEWVEDNTLYWIEFAFAMFYMLELFVKLVAMPWETYWEDNVNRFDFFVTIVLCTVAIVWASAGVACSA